MQPSRFTMHIKACLQFIGKLFLCSFILSNLGVLSDFTTTVYAHDLTRLHEHNYENNTYTPTPRPVHIRFIAPKLAGEDLNITVRFQAVDDDHTIVAGQTKWAGTPNDLQFFDLKAYSDQGERRLVKKLGKKRYRINTNPGEWVELRYAIQVNDNAHSANTQYRNIYTDKLFHGIGQMFLVLPEDNLNELINVSIDWQDFERINWTTVQAVAADERQHEVLSKSALLSSVFMAGDIELHESLTPYGVIKVAMQKANWRFKPDEFAVLTRQIVQTEREFFAKKVNPDAPALLISLIEVANDLDGISIGGTSLHNSFAMFVSPKAQLMQTDYGAPNTTIGFVLAHEMMHQWIGHALKTNEKPEALGYWFTEGFTDYFSLQVLYQRQLITLDSYVDMLNHFLKTYWLSPKRNIDNSAIASGFWRDSTIERMPYLRGFLIALMTDQRMRLTSDLRLHGLMKKMLAHSDGIANHSAISNRSMLYNIQKRTSEEFVDHLREVVAYGRTVKLDHNILNPCIKLTRKALGNYDPGFDLDKSEASKIITGVKSNSGAYDAGLRSGQKMAGWSISNNTEEKSNVSIYIDDIGSTKTYEFFPVGATTFVPQASINDSESCKGIL